MISNLERKLLILVCFYLFGVSVSHFVPPMYREIMPLETFIEFKSVEPKVENDGSVSFILERETKTAYKGDLSAGLVVMKSANLQTDFGKTVVMSDVVFESSTATKHIKQEVFENVPSGDYYLDLFIEVDLGHGVTRNKYLQSELFTI